MKYLSILIFLSFLLLAFECSKDDNDPMLKQDVLFVRMYENHAWGDQYEGWLIDNSGFIRGFSAERNPEMEWLDLSGGSFITENIVLEQYYHTDTTFMNLPLSDLVKYYQMIPAASRGILKEAVPNGADMGQMSYYGLILDEENSRYRFILLESYGDFIINNTAEESQKLAGWMKDLDQLISYNQQ